jgi:hypothetical protein
MGPCDECGSRQVALRRIEGVDVEECGLCGHLMGDDAAVGVVEQRREARERGFDAAVFPLVVALERVPTFRVDGASGGEAGQGDYPYVFLRLDPQGLPDLERLLTVLEMANHATKRRWVVECALQRGLLFILRPRFWKPVTSITAEDVTESRSDLGVLAEVLARNVAASWWRERRPPPPRGGTRRP